MFVAALEDGFRRIINENQIVSNEKQNSAKLLAQYCDILLKKNSQLKLEDLELENRLEMCTQLFKFIDDKDIFHKYFSTHLAHRLIEDLSGGEEYEQLIIRGLQQISGMEYTSKLQRMFQDIKIGYGINLQFKEYCEEQKILYPVDFSSLVLTTGSWPLSNSSASQFNIPEQLKICTEGFENFYNTIHNGRRLTWIHHCSKGEIFARFSSKTYQITMPAFMVATLLLFNDSSILNYEEIQNATNLVDSDLRRVLKVLVTQRLLITDLKTLNKNTKFKVNSKFKHKTLKLKLGGNIQVEKTNQNVSNTGITADRKLLLQATIVRIMKMRKEATHTQLIQEVLEQSNSHFVPGVQQIKKVIETLIDKEYLARVEGQNKYQYLA